MIDYVKVWNTGMLADVGRGVERSMLVSLPVPNIVVGFQYHGLLATRTGMKLHLFPMNKRPIPACVRYRYHVKACKLDMEIRIQALK